MTERISRIDLNSSDPMIKLLFEGATNMLGRVPNFYRTGAHVPFIQMMLLPFNACTQREGGGGNLSTKLKEMAVIKTSQVNGCNY